MACLSAGDHDDMRARLRARTGLWAALALLALAGTSAAADPARLINEIRAQGCGTRPVAAPPMRVERKLTEAAQRLAQGATLDAALPLSGYRPAKAVSIHIQGNEGDAVIARILREQFCPQVSDPEFREMGSAWRGEHLWIVLARPFTAPARREAASVNRRVLELVNQARAQPRRCGDLPFEAAGPLQHSVVLEQAALAHAQDMAARSVLSHTGSDGSTPAERATRAGYAWRIVAENIAAGPTTPEEVVEDWLSSPRHCSNIMNARFADMGVAYAVDAASRHGIYWAQVFATPR